MSLGGRLYQPPTSTDWHRNTEYQCRSVQSVGIYVPRMDTDCPPKLLPPYAAHTQVFFSLKINFRSFFFVYMRAMPSRRVAMLYLRTPPVYGHSYFTIVQRLPLHIPPKLLPPYAAHTQVFFSLKINFRPKHLCMCIFFCTFAR